MIGNKCLVLIVFLKLTTLLHMQRKDDDRNCVSAYICKW